MIVMCRFFRVLGSEVIQAADGTESLAAAVQYPCPIDLLISGGLSERPRWLYLAERRNRRIPFGASVSGYE